MCPIYTHDGASAKFSTTQTKRIAVLHTVLSGVIVGGLLLPEHYEDCIFRQGLEVLGILHLRPGDRVH